VKKKKVLLLVSFVVILTLACGFDLGTQQPQPQPQVTVVVVTVPVPVEPQQQQPVQTQPPVVVTEVPPSVATQPPAVEPSKVMFTADKDLSCAEGPDWQRYWFAEVLSDGEEAEVLAVSGDYGQIKLNNKKCWVWLEGGEVYGDTGTLPEEQPPKLPVVYVEVFNNLGQKVYLTFNHWGDSQFWKAGKREGNLTLEKGMTRKIKLTSDFYIIWGYPMIGNDVGTKPIFQSGQIDLAVGDTYHIKGLKDSEFNPPLIVIP
jgi:hypothetical protein